MDRYSSILRAHDLKVTPQRLCILSELDKKHHPSMDELCEVIRATYPNISIATIYKNLNCLIKKGIAMSFDVGDKVCFDICTHQHIHCICDNCGEVFHTEIQVDKYADLLKNDTGLDASFVKIVFNVRKCKKCQSKSK